MILSPLIGVFRGTSELNFLDELQNLNPGFQKVPKTENCYVRSGFYRAYFTRYQLEFEQSIRDCVNSCSNERCNLILTGGSQGASVAVVAAIYLLKEFDPFVITFGVMRTFLPTSPFNEHEECTNINKERHFHFILTDIHLQRYDPIPYFFGFWSKNVGHEILYDGEGNFNYQGLSKNYNMRRSPSSFKIHTRWNYVSKTEQAYKNICFPYPSKGWFDGHWCSDDDVCMDTSYCQDGFCAPLLDIGDICTRDGACRSASCMDGHCSNEMKVLANATEPCRTDKDCRSGRCEGWWPSLSLCHERLDSGDKCNEHSDCLSGHCAGLFIGKCI